MLKRAGAAGNTEKQAARGRASRAVPPAKTRARAASDETRSATSLALRDRLREAGLRATPGRIAVLQELGTLSSPISHAELAERLHGAEFDRVTVWRILVALTEAGLVDRSDLGDRTWRFELRRQAHGNTLHPHFMCVSCNAVQCLPADAVQVTPRLNRSVVEVQLKGRCASCA